MSLDFHVIPALQDNYIFLAHDPETGVTAAVDPAEAAPVLEALDDLGLRLSHILNTHHHPDHVGGNLALKAATGCTIVGPAADAARIPGIDVQVDDGDSVSLGSATGQVFFLPGHTRGHIAYWFAQDEALFVGDTLFAMGCGRLFEGTAAQMWSSLCRLRALPGVTRVFCAHEYTQANARFALTVDPENRALRLRAKLVDLMRSQGLSTVPFTLGEERVTNPFMRADRPKLAAALGMDPADPVAIFAEIRGRKDRF
jgi:hydroxyacylglutathione hydrolase